MIESVRLKNFKGHADSTVALAPLTILVGPNGAGKTSVLEALHYLGQCYYKDPSDLFAGPRSLDNLLRHHPSVDALALEAEGVSASARRRFQFDAQRRDTEDDDGEGDAQRRSRWSCAAAGSNGDVPWSTTFPSNTFRREHGEDWPELRRAVLLRLDARTTAAPSTAASGARVGYDGKGTATVLANLKLQDEESFGKIQDDLRAIVPQVERIRVVPFDVPSEAGGASSAAYRLSLDMRSGAGVSASMVSEGTLLTLALLTVLHGPSRPKLILLDDIHEALHPTAQRRLMEMLTSLVEREPVQVVATTHSPYIVDMVPPETVRVFAVRPDGTSANCSLAEHPEAEHYRGALSSGQLWTLDDEQTWVLARRPG